MPVYTIYLINRRLVLLESIPIDRFNPSFPPPSIPHNGGEETDPSAKKQQPQQIDRSIIILILSQRLTRPHTIHLDRSRDP